MTARACPSGSSISIAPPTFHCPCLFLQSAPAPASLDPIGLFFAPLRRDERGSLTSRSPLTREGACYETVEALPNYPSLDSHAGETD